MNISPGKPPSRFKCTSSGRISAALYIFLYLYIRVSILFSIWHAHRVIKQAYWTSISRICAQMHVKGRAYICRGITLPTPICALAPAESPTYYYYWKWLIRASLLASLAFFLGLFPWPYISHYRSYTKLRGMACENNTSSRDQEPLTLRTFLPS